MWGRLVLAGVASSRAEIEDRWSLEDLMRAHLVLDYHQEVERSKMPASED